MELPVLDLRQMIMGFRTTQLLHVAAKLELADRISKEPRSSDALAAEVGADPDAVYRLMRALASLGVFTEGAERVFALTVAGESLTKNRHGSMHDVALLYGESWVWEAYGNMLFSVKTGKSAFPETHGLPFYEFLDRNPQATDVFQAAMSSFSGQEAEAILNAYDFSQVHTLIDIGAGQGALLTAILQANPQLSGTAFDLPASAAQANRLFAEAELTNRATFAAGDFFAEVPPGGDLYLFKSVLHNWGDAEARRILSTCRKAMSDRSRLLLIERIVPPGDTPSDAKLFDINMLVSVGGRERTEAEYRNLLAEAGFVLSRLIPTQSPLTLLEAKPEPI